MDNLPKVLIVARNVWDDSQGISSTLTNLFSNYGSDKLSMIYVEAKIPNTKCCHSFFQIPEIMMVKKCLHWGIKVGKRIDTSNQVERNVKDIESEEKTLNYVRGHRSIFFSWMREILWLFGFWKTKELLSFIKDVNPDVVWFDGSTNIFLDRLYLYVLRKSKKPGVIYLMDDNYTYHSMTGHRYLYHFLHRVTMRKIVTRCKDVLMISPKMKREFDALFKVNGTIITKGIEFSNKAYLPYDAHKPVRLLYMGQIIYGRYKTLCMIIKAINELNEKEKKISLDIYTNNLIPEELRTLIAKSDCVQLNKAVPYEMVSAIISENDVLLFMESIDPKYSRDARLSFSTKITDYLSSGKCILAVGPKDCAPMEYFEQESCAVTSHSQQGIIKALQTICDPAVVKKYSQQAFETGKKNHDENIMRERLYKFLQQVSN